MFEDEFNVDKLMHKRKSKKSGTVLKKDIHDVLLIVLDCGKTMNSTEDDATSFKLAKNAVDWIISRKIFAQAKDRASIILFGCNKTRNSIHIPNVFVYEDLFSQAKFDHLRFLEREVDLCTEHQSNVIDALVVATEFMKEQIHGDPAVEGKSILLFTNGLGVFSEDSQELTNISSTIKAIGINLIVVYVFHTLPY
uniref:VWFA domain-containing protein n=1 Tax=Heterorhabditis bacteriophora TaxID=37862 RepID=A0A1I7XFT2_HETBA